MKIKGIFTKEFWSYAGERAIKTVAQTASAALGTNVVLSATGVPQIDIVALLATSLLAGVASVLTSIANFKESI